MIETMQKRGSPESKQVKTEGILTPQVFKSDYAIWRSFLCYRPHSLTSIRSSKHQAWGCPKITGLRRRRTCAALGMGLLCLK